MTHDDVCELLAHWLMTALVQWMLPRINSSCLAGVMYVK